ncbi:Mut7-C RNAse domain-containing protein [Methanofollis sp. UBA420]|uniref:Mut7-C RNAse domain-containing protein n=1 Tax=Methanofollis sp. UBA420 TaxID=1915514 RepID=UPI00316AC12A
MSGRSEGRPRFLADRMLGVLTRHLRLMGYDTLSANALTPGNPREDTVLLAIAETDGRILLTRDAELARRAGGRGVYIRSADVMEQERQLVDRGLIRQEFTFDRCSVCNTPLRPAQKKEVLGAAYAPRKPEGLSFFWCPICRRLYWEGSHTARMRREVGKKEESSRPG